MKQPWVFLSIKSSMAGVSVAISANVAVRVENRNLQTGFDCVQWTL